MGHMPSRIRLIAAAVIAAGALHPAGAHEPPDRVPRIAGTLVLPGTSTQEPAPAAVAPAGCVQRTTSETNAADTVPGRQTQVVYFVPKDRIDECLDGSALPNSMRSLNAFFSAQGLGPLRLDLAAGGVIDIPFVRGNSNQSAYDGVGDLEAELRARGFNSSTKRYVVFAAIGLGGTCGEAEYPGDYAAFFLDSAAGCGVRNFGDGTLAGAGAAEVVAGQEILHNEGVVDLLAPNGCQVSLGHFAHVCTPGGVLVEFDRLDPEYVDIMFPFAIPGVRLSQKVLDRNRDDYFKVRPAYGFLLTDLEDSLYFQHP